MMNGAERRVAVITGGAQGLGAATATRFLANGFAGVLLVDRNAKKLAETARSLEVGGKVFTCTADLRDDGVAEKVMNQAETRFGRVDVLINAAGNTERCGIDDTTPEAFDRIFETNVKAPFFLMQQAIKAMRTQGSGVIVNVASMLAYGGPPNLSTYSSSKAALVTLTRSVANTVKREGIRCFAINLGWVATDGEHALQTSFHRMPTDWAAHIGARMPAGRMITSEDVAELMVFLVSPAAQMMNGAVIDYEQMPVGVFDSHPALAPE
jgi:NAD(P)-dependent dehydrogenase (short-subunit alcohol dehydrogenase family)